MNNLSLRTRVTLAATAATTLVVLIVSVIAWTQITDSASGALNGKVDTLSAAMQPNISALNWATVQQSQSDGALVTFRFEGAKVAGTAVDIPLRAPGTGDMTINGKRYRVKTNYVIDTPQLQQLAQVSVAVPLQPTLDRIDRQHWALVGIAVGAIALSALLAWLLGGLAVRPLRRLADRTATLPVDPGTDNRRRARLLDITGAREATEIATAMDSLLGRVDAEHARTADALATARDFSSVSAHELRTPLTAMRTDLEVLATMNPSEADRAAIIGDLRTSHARVVETLGALESLAQGSLGGAPRDAVDLADLVDRVVTEATRSHPGLQIIQGQPDGPVPATVIESGIRMVLENAVKNAVRHGGATRVVITAEYLPGAWRLRVDDNGRGIPEADRGRLFERFVRGDSPEPGSGLGLALVAQQAELHGGTATLTDSPLGGTRLEVTGGQVGATESRPAAASQPSAPA
ncbi:sensor histidine kinase [Jongsikchunia kroppenstedtii]|uniref:sensor histidine kinase n=1 Tax=Jongsikchunia kroppenstedtii TaxID=1121721 RepID=UPI00036438CD|nr:HAMP domain-containing sensor histidine kinase [Jongsikchunia kroppenstedtii]